MQRHPNLKYLAFVLALLLFACEQAGNNSSQHLSFRVDASQSDQGWDTNLNSRSEQQIKATGVSFLMADSASGGASGFTPTRLNITFSRPGDLVPSMLLPLGYRVTTRIEFDDGSDISINHTNVADSLYVVQGDSLGDTLYLSIHGEGFVSSGKNVFEDVTGLFSEQSTYRIVNDTLITNISCSYELMIDY